MNARIVAWFAEVSAANARVEGMRVANIAHEAKNPGADPYYPERDFMLEAASIQSIANAAGEHVRSGYGD